MVFGIGKKSGGDYSSGSEKHSPSEEGQRDPFTNQQYDSNAGIGKDGLTDPNDAGHSLHRGLSARQITMIAIGGAIGTGLIIGTGAALVKSGPGSILISYTITGLLVYMVMCALGEMCTSDRDCCKGKYHKLTIPQQHGYQVAEVSQHMRLASSIPRSASHWATPTGSNISS